MNAIEYRADKDALVVTGDAAGRAIVARLNGALAKPARGEVLLPATSAFAGNVDALLPDAGWSQDASLVLQRSQRAVAARRFRTAALDELEPMPVKPGSDLHELHQRQAYHFARAQDGVGLWIAMGGGKSRVCVALAVDCVQRQTALRRDAIWRAGEHEGRRLTPPPMIVVTCPRTVVDEDDVWGKQFARWAPDDVPFLVGGRVLRRKGRGGKARPSVKERLAQLQDDERLAVARGVPFVAVVPWDSYWRAGLADWLLARRWDLWIADEIHRAKAPGGKAGMFAARLRRQCDRRVGNSGTPLPHDKLDAYGVYRALDPGVFGTNFHRMKRRYAVTRALPNAPGAEMIVGWQNEEDFDRKFHSVAYVWEQDREVLGIGEPTVIERTVTLTNATWRVYRDLDRELAADVGAGVVTASNALVRLLRLQQVLSGVVTLTDGQRHQLGTEKADSLADWLEDLKSAEPVGVVARFHGDLDGARRAAGKRRYAELSGRPAIEGRLSFDAWTRGDADVLGVQIQAGGAGIDLTRARYAAYLSIGFNLGELDQSHARYDRPPPDRLPDAERIRRSWPPVFVRFIAEGPHGESTIDHEAWEAMDARRSAVGAILANRQKRGR